MSHITLKAAKKENRIQDAMRFPGRAAKPLYLFLSRHAQRALLSLKNTTPTALTLELSNLLILRYYNAHFTLKIGRSSVHIQAGSMEGKARAASANLSKEKHGHTRLVVRSVLSSRDASS